jgi:hypothetical protein
MAAKPLPSLICPHRIRLIGITLLRRPMTQNLSRASTSPQTRAISETGPLILFYDAREAKGWKRIAREGAPVYFPFTAP